MSSAQSFHFTAELEVPSDSLIVEYAEAVYDSEWSSCPLNYFIGVKFQVRGVWHSQYNRLSTGKYTSEVTLNTNINQTFLITEEPCQ
jgi:hypothetical protein